MKITDYEKVTELSPNNMFLIDGDSGTKTILSKELLKALVKATPNVDYLNNIEFSNLDELSKNQMDDFLIASTPTGLNKIYLKDGIYKIVEGIQDKKASLNIRSLIYRGKNLGSVISSDQWNSISNGDFKDMFIGDYWHIGGRFWHIMGFNTLKNSSVITPDDGYTYANNKNHLFVMPKESIGHIPPPSDLSPTSNVFYSEEQFKESGFVGSLFYDYYVPNSYEPIVFGDFGEEHVLYAWYVLYSGINNAKQNLYTSNRVRIILPSGNLFSFLTNLNDVYRPISNFKISGSSLDDVFVNYSYYLNEAMYDLPTNQCKIGYAFRSGNVNYSEIKDASRFVVYRPGCLIG